MRFSLKGDIPKSAPPLLDVGKSYPARFLVYRKETVECILRIGGKYRTLSIHLAPSQILGFITDNLVSLCNKVFHKQLCVMQITAFTHGRPECIPFFEGKSMLEYISSSIEFLDALRKAKLQSKFSKFPEPLVNIPVPEFTGVEAPHLDLPAPPGPGVSQQSFFNYCCGIPLFEDTSCSAPLNVVPKIKANIPDPDFDISGDSDSDPQTDLVPDPQSDPIPDPPADPIPDPQSDPIPDPPADPIPDSQVDLVPDPQVDLVPDPQVDLVPDPQVDLVLDPQADSIPDPQADPISEDLSGEPEKNNSDDGFESLESYCE